MQHRDHIVIRDKRDQQIALCLVVGGLPATGFITALIYRFF
jgi:hypothetical protein